MESIEIWGYFAMCIVLISMMMKNMKWLRILNSIACAMFVLYGFALGAYPIIIMNILVIVINLSRLKKEL
jgi:hypothetical protein